jgi:steroid delta-isomerase-like uncharacterized protein
MPTDHKQILARFLQEVWTDGKIDAIDQYLAPTYTIVHDPGDPWDGQTLDLAGFKQRVLQSRAPFPDQRFTVHELIAESDKVVASWFWTGTHTGDLPGFPASGKVVEISGMTVYYFEDDRLSGHWQVTDRLGVYQQLSQ